MKSKLLPLKMRREMSVCKLVFKKILINPDILRESQRLGNRSSNKRLVQLFVPKSNRFKNNLPYAGYAYWNKLPDELRMAKDYNVFKALLSKYMYTKFCKDGFV